MRGAWFAVGAVAVGLAGCHGGDDGDGDGSATDPLAIPEPGTPYARLPITANFQWTKVRVNDKQVMYYAPEDPPLGLLFAFHGTNGSIASVQQEEWLELYNLVVPVGMALVLTESLDRQVQQWVTDPGLDNPDFQQLVDVRQYLIDNSSVDEDTPVVDVGFSNGGDYANIFAGQALASGWDIRTFSVHQHKGYNPSVPALFFSAENDDNHTASLMRPIAEQCTNFMGTACPLIEGTEIPMSPLRFARIPNYDEHQSQSIFDELVTMQFIDADGKRLVDALDVDALMDTYIQNTHAPSPTLPPTQIRVVWATHRYSSQHVYEEAVWLVDHLR